jgi:DNA polymerase III subunit delta'
VIPASDLPWLAEPLANALRQQRGHALLVYGPTGVGQFEFAVMLARAWLCEATNDQRAAGLACGQCASCHLVDARGHPDLRVLLPEALEEALGWASDEPPEESGDSKRRQPSKEIRVGQVRAALQFSELTRGRSRHKVVIAYPAERMNAVAANALLKTLEEPPPGQRFVLATEAADRLLPTVRSRCQAVRLELPARDVALHWLAGQKVAQPEVLLAAAGGSPLLARDWELAGIDSATWAALPGSVRRGDASVLSGWPVPRAVDALQRVCHDALSMAAGGQPRFFVGLRPAPGAQLSELLAWSRELSRAARHAEHPWNAGLLNEALVTQGRDALGGDAGQRGRR